MMHEFTPSGSQNHRSAELFRANRAARKTVFFQKLQPETVKAGEIQGSPVLRRIGIRDWRPFWSRCDVQVGIDLEYGVSADPVLRGNLVKRFTGRISVRRVGVEVSPGV